MKKPRVILALRRRACRLACLLGLVMTAIVSMGQASLPVQWIYTPVATASGLAYSPDGKMLAVVGGPYISLSINQTSWPAGIQIFATSTNSFLKCLPTAATSPAYSAAFSPGSTTLVDGGTIYNPTTASYSGVLELWNVGSGKLIRSIDTASLVVTSVAFSPDGKTIAASGAGIDASGNWNGVLEIWRAADGGLVRSLPTTEGGYLSSCLAYSPDGKTLAHSGPWIGVELWNVASGSLVGTLASAASPVMTAAFSLDGKTLAIGGGNASSGVLELWSMANLSRVELPTKAWEVNSVCFSPDGKSLAVADAGTTASNQNRVLEIWDVPGQALDKALVTEVNSLSAVAFSPDGKTVASGTAEDYMAGTVQLWDAESGNALTTLGTNRTPYPQNVCAVSPDGKLVAEGGSLGFSASGSYVGYVTLLNAQTGAVAATLNTAAGDISVLSFSSDGTKLAVGGDGGLDGGNNLELWTVPSAKLIETLPAMPGINALAFSPNNEWLATGGNDGSLSLELWNVATGAMTSYNTQNRGGVFSVAFSPDGTTLADGGYEYDSDGGNSGVIELWNIANGQSSSAESANIFGVTSLAFSKDGATLADIGEGNTLELWKLSGASLPSSPAFSSSAVTGGSVGYSADGSVILISGAADGSVHAFSIESGAVIESFSGPPSQMAICSGAPELVFSDVGLCMTANPFFGSDRLTQLTLAPSQIASGGTSTGTVKLAKAAPTGGNVVGLTSANSFVTVPASVTVPAGSTSASFAISTDLLMGTLAVPITATSGGYSASATLTVTTSLVGVSVSPSSVIGGTATTGTVTLTGAAPAGGLTISLSSNSASAKVPASVTIGSGSSSATFNIATSAVSSLTTVTITAKSGTISQSATVTIQPAKLQAMALSASSVIGGSTTAVTGTVTLSGPAGPNGTSVALTSSNPTAATVPASVTVKAGATTASFAVTSLVVASNTTAKISAKLSGSTTQTQTLTVDALKVTGLSLDPTSVIGGSSSTGTVTLSAPVAHAVSVPLTASSTDLGVPKTVSVSAKASKATFTVTTKAVATTTTGTVTATLGGASKSSNLSIKAAGLDTNSLNPTTVTGGSSSTGTVTLTGPAPSGGFKISLSSSNASAQTPATVTVAAGKTSATYKVTTSKVKKTTTSLIEALVGSIHRTVKLTINP